MIHIMSVLSVYKIFIKIKLNIFLKVQGKKNKCQKKNAYEFPIIYN